MSNKEYVATHTFRKPLFKAIQSRSKMRGYRQTILYPRLEAMLKTIQLEGETCGQLNVAGGVD